MEQVGIAIYVPEGVAVAAGKATFGETVFRPQARELAELTTLERNFVATRYVGPTADHVLVLDTADPTWDDVAAAIRRDMARSTATERQRQEATEEAREHARRQQEQRLRAWAETAYPAEMRQVVEEAESVAAYVGHLVAADLHKLLQEVVPSVGFYTVGSKPHSMIKLRRRLSPRAESVQVKIWAEEAAAKASLPPDCTYDVAVERLDVKPSDPKGYGVHITVATVRLRHPLWPERIFVLPTERVPGAWEAER